MKDDFDRCVAVFIGKVIWHRAQGPPPWEKPPPHGYTAVGEGDLVKMKVVRSWKGVQKGSVVLVWTTSSDCGYRFYGPPLHLIFGGVPSASGREVIARHPAVGKKGLDRVLVTNYCSHSRSLGSEETTAELDSLDSWRAGGVISKRIRPWWKAAVPDAGNGRPSQAASARGGFDFVFETGYGERVDTFHGLVTKDLVSLPDTTIALALAPADLDSIHRMMTKVHLFELPDLRAPDGCLVRPNTWERLLVRVGSVERTFRWETQWGCSDSLRASESWKDLHEVVRLIRRIVEAKPDYKALPPPRGAYE